MSNPIGTVGLGAVMPSTEMMAAAGANATSNDPLAVLQAILSTMQKIQVRVAPDPLMLKVPISLAAGAATPPISTNATTFNGFIVDLSAGAVTVYLGGNKIAEPLLDLVAGTTPYNLHIPNLSSQQLIFVNNGAMAAQGVIYVTSW